MKIMWRGHQIYHDGSVFASSILVEDSLIEKIVLTTSRIPRATKFREETQNGNLHWHASASIIYKDALSLPDVCQRGYCAGIDRETAGDYHNRLFNLLDKMILCEEIVTIEKIQKEMQKSSIISA